MAKVWSFNTTVRNPERMQNFLRVLKVFEGRTFDEECQKDFFAAQIQKRLYKPTPRTLVDSDLINEVNKETAEEVPETIVNRIVDLYMDKPVNPAARGRTTAGILNRFGLCIASNARGAVKITDLGNKWLNGEIDDQELFFKFLLKWQYPNPMEYGYSNFNIKPFIGTLTLIKRVNDKWFSKGNRPVGFSKSEFMFFVPSLKKHTDIESTAEKVVEYRLELAAKSGRERRDYEKRFIARRVKETGEKLSNLRDYTDSAIRYFRMTGFVYLRGSNTHIDLSPDHMVEIERLLESNNASASAFSDIQGYVSYLVDIKLPSLPWENEADLSLIKTEMLGTLQSLSRTLGKEAALDSLLPSIAVLSPSKQVELLKNFKNSLQIEKLRSLKYDKEKLREIILSIPSVLSNRTVTVTTRPSLDLEWFVSLSLMVMNDAKDILPSYKLGDDGLPTGFSSNIADIECLYEKFGMIVEVTLIVGRDQWHAEGYAVQRHLRDFEKKYQSYGDNIYCLFIAPYLHSDALEAYWNANKHGYQGKCQKIIPLRIVQYVEILSIIKRSLEKNVNPQHDKYEDLLRSLYDGCQTTEHVDIWINTFDTIIGNWKKRLL